MVSWLAIFLIVALTDIVWARYISCAAQGKRLGGSVYAVIITLMGGFTMTSYVHDLWLLVPAGAGAFVGTYLIIGRK
jgi:hypothetical protein